jgi:parvulin-like peptidyl-prolyl isomerase
MFREGFRKSVAAPSSWKTRAGVILCGVAVLAACGTARYFWGMSSANAQVAESIIPPSNSAPAGQASSGQSSSAQPSRTNAVPTGNMPIPDIVASVNGHAITRDELAAECRIHYGKDVLESMVNKFLILTECQRLGITVSHREVDEEIQQLAASFKLPVQQWLKMLQQERGIKPDQYANDIIWPSLALRKLAGEKLQVSQKELTDAFEMEYGAAVKARIIVCTTEQKAHEAQALAAANPSDFGNLAKEYSVDAPSASVKGLIQPIRKHCACPEIEEAAFALADGQISNVIRSQGQFVVVKREGLIQAQNIKLEQVADRLTKIIRDKKMRGVAGDIFKELQKRTRVQNVYNDDRLRQRVGANVVALVNDTPIYLRQLDDECLARHGADVLQALIGRRTLELECQQKQITVSEQEIDAEIARLAAMLTRPLPDGSPDIKGWLAIVTKQQGVSVDIYRHEKIWPSIALRKLAWSKIDVTDDDLKKGFEANYGPRVRCRAIVLNDQHRAEKVWEEARNNKTADYFGELAAKYSIERSSRALFGQVPPIRKNGGQKQLEDEAFRLQPGDLSGLINIDGKFIILFCEGYTKPIDVSFASVKKDIEDDIREKKQRVAMAEYYQHMQDNATIDNFLEPELSHVPPKPDPTRQPVVPTAYNMPAQR